MPGGFIDACQDGFLPGQSARTLFALFHHCDALFNPAGLVPGLQEPLLEVGKLALRGLEGRFFVGPHVEEHAGLGRLDWNFLQLLP